MKNILVFACVLVFACCRKDVASTVKVVNNDSVSGKIEELGDTLFPEETLSEVLPDESDTLKGYTVNRNHYLYVSLNNKKEIAVYSIDTMTGQLNLIETESTQGSPGSLSFSKNKRYLYAALRSTHQVASFRINPKTGELNLVHVTPVAGDPVYISSDYTNKFLLTTYFFGNKLAIYPINGDSIINQQVVHEANIAGNPHCILNSTNNKNTYVPVMTAGDVYQFSFDEEKGVLTDLSPAKLSFGDHIGPRHMSFHPNTKWAYIVNEINNTVYAYSIDASGALSKFDEINTLPSSFTEFSKCADIHVTPNGKYVYASNRGHNSIAAFAIDQSNGKMTLVRQYDTEPYPREFEIESTGRFLYSGGEDSGKIAMYTINNDGSLSLSKTYTVGEKVSWIASVVLP